MYVKELFFSHTVRVSCCSQMSPNLSVMNIEPKLGLQNNLSGGTQYKRSYGDVPPTWKANSTSWYINDPLFYDIWYKWVIFSKIWGKFKKICKTSSNFGQNLVQTWANWYMNGSKSWYLYGFKFSAACPYQNQTWVTPGIIVLYTLPND